MDRRKFLSAAAGSSLAFALPTLSFAQSEEKPDFEIAGTAQTDPAGYEIAWSRDWTLRDDLSPLLEKTVPGTRGFVALDIPSIPGIEGSSNDRTIIETVFDASATDAEAYIAAIPNNRMEQEGYAPGTYIHSRHVTDLGGWICFAADSADHSQGLRGIELFYLPQSPGDPVLIVSGNFVTPSAPEYRPEYLEFLDSTISINGNWLFGMDDLGNYWDAIEAVSDGPIS